MSKIDLISNEWTDLVFEGRNQAYGAYKLRLYGVQQAEDVKNLYDLPNLLLQKLPTENFTGIHFCFSGL